MPSSATPHLDDRVLPPQLAVLIVSVISKLGASKEALFEQLSFAESTLYEDERLLSFAEMYALIEAALEVSSTPWLGLEVGQEETVSTWGVLGYAVMSCATEREAVELGAQFYAAAPSLMKSSSSIEDGMLRIQMDPIHDMPHLLPFCVEENIAGIASVSSSYLMEPMLPTEIWVTYQAPEYADRYQDMFKCPIKFGQAANVLWAREPTDAPLRTSDPISAQLCLKLVEQVIAKHSGESDFVSQMRELLLQKPGELPSMNEAAAKLSVSVRTLRRRLAELGTSFKQINEEVRRDLALDYLRNTHMTVDQIGHLLGYTETTNFRRAFKQWTGKPPTAYRG